MHPAIGGAHWRQRTLRHAAAHEPGARIEHACARRWRTGDAGCMAVPAPARGRPRASRAACQPGRSTAGGTRPHVHEQPSVERRAWRSLRYGGCWLWPKLVSPDRIRMRAKPYRCEFRRLRSADPSLSAKAALVTPAQLRDQRGIEPRMCPGHTASAQIGSVGQLLPEHAGLEVGASLPAAYAQSRARRTKIDSLSASIFWLYYIDICVRKYTIRAYL